ncbi:MAG: class I SAM-dependent methyltransferase [Cytophagales bacterium]|nr:class I SAM-dependent methyltransferase [Cytophagales bacterium]MDW8383853.1 class I SAM-dependent methyltransferase [Flammeovirgaceae bacterium]
MTTTSSWYHNWFDSPYYHLLYEHRNDGEAEFFLRNLIYKLRWLPTYKILDVGCGKGRHARFLNAQGFDVTGIDLSPESIAYNKTFENERLHFEVWDMRKPYAKNRFDVVLNLFTSFGYFETEEEHIQTLQAFSQALRSEGSVIIDFMNVHKVIRTLVTEEYLRRGNVLFHIRRYIQNGFIVKEIVLEDQDTVHHFQEKVRAYALEDFQNLLNLVHIEIQQVFGNYRLEPYNACSSERLILVGKVAKKSA